MIEFNLLPYPIDMFPLLPVGILDEAGVLYNTPAAGTRAAYHPTYIAQYALAHWNAYLASGGDEHKEAFMTQALWLQANELHLSGGASGWSIQCALPDYHIFQPWLSALTQGNVISVLLRAYQLTSEDAFLHTAHRAVRLFEQDVLDGGVSTSIGDKGVFFEEVAVCPAAHILKGYILALFGLYDYVAITHDSSIKALIERSLATLHTLIDEYDTGYWTYFDLLHKRLASRFYHSLHVTLLETLSTYSGCEHCMEVAARWAGYQRRLGCRLHHLIASHATAYYDNTLKPKLCHLFLGVDDIQPKKPLERVCVPITAFPVPGGMRGVLAGVAQVMSDTWQLAYLTQQKGHDAKGLEIEVFGRKIASPWHFPGVWLYCLAGGSKLFTLLRHSSDYSLILPQDGVVTGAFAALVGKMMGIRVVCMDHGNVTLLDNHSFRMEMMSAFNAYPWHRRFLSRWQLVWYWPSQRLLARIATHCTDQFLVAGDEVEEVYRTHLGVHSSRIIRYAYMIDVARFTPLDEEARVKIRVAQDFSAEAIVITMINRLAPEKGMQFALEGIALAFSALPPHIQQRVRVLIVGDGPLRSQVALDIQRLGLEVVCTLWGEAKPSDVVMLLGISDIFLYSGIRGANYSVAVLEAMAAGCAVVASTVPQSNARLLADGRGIAVTSGSAAEISTALARLCSDLALCHQMGRMAREHIVAYHNAHMLRRSLLRASFFAPTIVVDDAKVCN